MISIRIIGSQSEVLDVWRSTFKVAETDFQSTSLRDAQADDRFICLLMPATVVYNRLGQRPIVGRSEVFDVSAAPRLRTADFKYIATTVLFPGRLRLSRAASEENDWRFEPRNPMTRTEQVEKLFGSLLVAVDEFNEVFSDAIPGLVIDLEVVNSTKESAYGDAKAALQTVQRHRIIKGFSDRFKQPVDQDQAVPFAALALGARPYPRPRNATLERVRQFYFTSSAREDASRLSFSEGQIIDAVLSGEVISARTSRFPMSMHLEIFGQENMGRFIEIRGVLDEKRQRLTIQSLSIKTPD